MSSLESIIQFHSTQCEELPLVHSTRCEFLYDIAISGTLAPRSCSVFHRSLVYLFYGRPAYRSSKGSAAGAPQTLCPVCFVFKPNSKTIKTRLIYPCDTGALASGLFEPDLTVADLKDLVVGKGIGDARRLVNLVFGTNKNYLLGQPLPTNVFSKSLVGHKYYELITRTGPQKFDDRRSAIEIQTEVPISLDDELLYVVLPRELLQDRFIRETILTKWRCDPEPYDLFVGSSPAEYYSVIRKIVIDRLFHGDRA